MSESYLKIVNSYCPALGLTTRINLVAQLVERLLLVAEGCGFKSHPMDGALSIDTGKINTQRSDTKAYLLKATISKDNDSSIKASLNPRQTVSCVDKISARYTARLGSFLTPITKY